MAKTDLSVLVVELERLFKDKHYKAKSIKLLNVGTDNADEYHWRFRTDAGEIITVSISREAIGA